MTGVVAYLSGAPRVSTRPEAESAGARAHVLGVVDAFGELGWDVERYVVGDLAPASVTAEGSRDRIASGRLWRAAADAGRITSAAVNGRRSHRSLGGRVDLVYERFGAYQALGRRFRRDGTPWILETNSVLHLEAAAVRRSIAFPRLVERAERRAYDECDVLVCVTELLRDLVVTRMDVDPRKVLVLPNGVDTARFDPAQFAPRAPGDHLEVGFVGGMYAWAGLDLLLEAVTRVRSSGRDVRVTLVGDGAELPALRAQAAALGIERAVTFAGRVPWTQVPERIHAIDVGYSGQLPVEPVGVMYHSPLKLYEYLAMGRPVVASAFDDATTLIRDRVDGFLFRPGDRTALEEALTEAFDRRAELPAWADGLRSSVTLRHSWEARVRDLLERSADILGARAPEILRP